jgi:hypothetical protein
MLSINRFAVNTSSLGYFTRLGSLLLSKTRQVLLYHSAPDFIIFISYFLINSPKSIGEIGHHPQSPL